MFDLDHLSADIGKLYYYTATIITLCVFVGHGNKLFVIHKIYNYIKTIYFILFMLLKTVLL